MAADLGITHIYAVNEASHIYNSFRYGKKSKDITLKYDELWEEHNGKLHNKYFYVLPLRATRKDLEPLKRQKRKLYRQRYAWLDQYEEDLRAAINPHLQAPVTLNVDLAKAS
jgi:uncharacterized protein VirK/YbjX